MPTSKRRRRARTALAIPFSLALTLTTGCATLFRPNTRQDVPVTTNARGAEVWVDGRIYGYAPLTMQLDTRTKHDITVRRGDDIRTWTLEPHPSTNGALFLAADTAVLAPGIWCAVKSFEEAQTLHYDNQIARVMGIACLVIAVPPLVIDIATNHVSELQPGEITVEFP